MDKKESEVLGAALTSWHMHSAPSLLDAMQKRKKYLPGNVKKAVKVISDSRLLGATTWDEALTLIEDSATEKYLYETEEKSVTWSKDFFLNELQKLQRKMIAEKAALQIYEGEKLEDVMDYLGESISTLDQRKSDLRIMTLEELREHPKVEWLISEIMPANSLACIYGPPGSGKSFLALDMAMKISCGGCFEDKTTASGRCIYVAGEGISGLSDRVSSWLNYETIDTGDLLVIGRPIDVANEYSKLINSCRKSKIQPKLLIIDTLARCFGANDENSTADMQRFIIAIDLIRVQLGCTVLVVHHSARNERKSMRGNSTLEGVMDTIIKVEALEQDDSKPQRILSRIVKQKDGPAGYKYYYDITPHADSAVLRGVPKGIVRGEMKGTSQGLLVTLKGMIHSDDQWVSAIKWRESYPQLGPDFAKTVADLVSDGYILYRKVGSSDQYRPQTPPD